MRGQALERADPTLAAKTVPVDVDGVLKWMAQSTPSEIWHFREGVIQRIELLGDSLRTMGKCEEWFTGCDPGIHAVAEGVNGPLLESLIE